MSSNEARAQAEAALREDDAHLSSAHHADDLASALRALLAALPETPTTDDDREALIELATWALIDYDTDVVDRGVSDEHYRERRADVERVFPILTSARRSSPPTEEQVEAAEMAILRVLVNGEPMAHEVLSAIRALGWAPVEAVARVGGEA